MWSETRAISSAPVPIRQGRLPLNQSWKSWKNAIHVGHSTGGGGVTRYVAQHGNGRVAKAVLISAIPPVMVKSKKNPGGTPIEVFDGYRAALAANRAQF